jgi:hypothetical protein
MKQRGEVTSTLKELNNLKSDNKLLYICIHIDIMTLTVNR